MYNIIVNFSIWNFWALIIGFIGAMLFADFMSGLVHWLADTWGTLETPIVGNNFIRSFREHHIDPVAMTRHDIFETNGDNAFLTLLTLYFMCRREIPYHRGIPDGWEYTQLCFWTFSCLWVALTNQIHKWAHTYKPPAFVVILQNCGLILSRKQHGIHHKPPFDKYYCITNGWMNKPLEIIHFWRGLERIISQLTGWKPREDDHKWTGLLPENPAIVQRTLQKNQQN
jgi:ubiquitin-conjugating enzyme E2 variant